MRSGAATLRLDRYWAMRDLDQYSGTDWLTAQPLVAAFKEVRDAAIREAFCARRGPNLERFLTDHADLRGGVMAITIAFEQPWLIDNLIKRFARLSRDARLVVCDNSRTPAARQEIEALCAAAAVPYLPLPVNFVRNINRSHGNSLNWAYRNIVTPLAPRIFGFIDHDLFPAAPFSFEESLGDQPVYGVKMNGGYGWALWAGYSMFDRAYIASRKPDFNPDMDRRLVTGGRNYDLIYRHLDLSSLRFADHSYHKYDNPVAGQEHFVSEFVDGWLHVGGASYHKHKMEGRAFYQAMIDAL